MVLLLRVTGWSTRVFFGDFMPGTTRSMQVTGFKPIVTTRYRG